MATAKINEKTMLNYEELVTTGPKQLASNILIDSKGVATYTNAAGEIVTLKGINGIYSNAADDFNEVIDVTGETNTRIHANDVVLGIEGSEFNIILEDYFASNGKKPFYVGGKDNGGDEPFITDLVSEAFLDNLNLYNEYNYAEKHSEDGKITTTKFTGTAFNDTFDLSGFSAAQLKDAKDKNITSLTINAGAGDDVVLGSIVDDVITGGAGTNTVLTSGATNQKFGDDTYKLTNGENLVVLDGVAEQTYEYTTDGTNATITAKHDVPVLNKEVNIGTEEAYIYNPVNDTYKTDNVPTDVYQLRKGDEQSIATANYTFAADGTIKKLAADDKAYKTIVVGDEVAINATGGTIDAVTKTIAQKAAVAADTYFDNVSLGAEKNYGQIGYVASDNNTVFTETAAAGVNIYLSGQEDVFASTLLTHIEFNNETGHWQYKAGDAHKIYGVKASETQSEANLVDADTLGGYIRYALTNGDDDYEGKVSEATALFKKVDGVYTKLTDAECTELTRNNLTPTPIASGTKTAMLEAAAVKDLYTDNGEGAWVVTDPTAVYALTGNGAAYAGKASAGGFLYTNNDVAEDSSLKAVPNNLIYAQYSEVTSEELGTLTIDKLAKQEGVAESITIGGQDLDDIQWNVVQDFSKKNTYNGSWLNETVDATTATKGIKVNTADGNDVILGSANNDTITGGRGFNEVDYNHFVADNGTFGTNTVNLTAETKTAMAEVLNVDLKSVIVDDQIVVSKSANGNDINVDVLKVKATITDSAINNAAATYQYNVAGPNKGKYTNGADAVVLYTDNAHETRYTKSISENINNNKWVATLYDENGAPVVTMNDDVTNADKFALSRYTLDDILYKTTAGDYESLGTVSLKNLGKNNDLANVLVNDADIFSNAYQINIDATKGGKVTSTKGNDLVYSKALEPTAVTYTNSNVLAQDFIDNTEYTLSGSVDTFKILDKAILPLEYNDSVEFVNTDVTFVDASKAKYAVDYTTSASKELSGNNLLVADATALPTTPALDIKTGKGNDVVIMKSVAAEGANKINYVGGVDAYQGSTGAETYTVTSMDKNTALTINDLGGADKLVFDTTSGATFKNMTIFFDVTAEGKTGDDSLMLINDDVLSNSKSLAALFNGTGKGAVVLENYFVENTEFEHGAGYIESVQLAGAQSGNSLDTQVAAITENVAAWLDNNGNYDSAMDVIEAGNAADIQSLMLCYSAGTVTVA